MLKNVLLIGLSVTAIAFVLVWAAAVRRRAVTDPGAPSPVMLAIGFGTNFLDTLGIGSFATTTSAFKLLNLVADQLVPGTLNVGHALPTIAEALIYITLVSVGGWTLTMLIAAAVAGAWLGAGIVSGWSRRAVQLGMGGALVAASLLMVMTQLQLFPAGGDALSLGGVRLIAGLAGNFMLGALMTLGIGLYAPCMILISLLGMDPRAAFPIMMGSCAFLMPAGSTRFIRQRRYSQRASLGLTVGGIPGVLLAAFLVRSLPLDAVRWLVIVVVVYTAAALLRSAARESAQVEEAPARDAASL